MSHVNFSQKVDCVTRHLICAALVVLFCSTFSSNCMAEFAEVKIKSANGVVYTIPAYGTSENKPIPVSVDSFYVKNENGNLVLIQDMDLKASLYGVSLMAYNIKDARYWAVRKEAEGLYHDLLGQIGLVRSDLVSPKGSLAAIVISAGGGCATGIAFGATAGTLAVPGIGTVTGAAAGCLTWGASSMAAATIDEAFATALELAGSYADWSREEIAKDEMAKMLGYVYAQSTTILAKSGNWIDNGQPITLETLVEISDMAITSEMILNAMFEYSKRMYPESVLLKSRYDSWFKTGYSWTGNALGIPGVPFSSIISTADYVNTLLEHSKNPDKYKFNAEISKIFDPKYRKVLQDLSPLSPTNHNVTKAVFEKREPVQYSGSFFSKGTNIFNIGEDVQIKSVMQKLDSVYQEGQVSYEVVDAKGNIIGSGFSSLMSGEYLSTFPAPNNPGAYNVALLAVDADGTQLGTSRLAFVVNNPAEGHDLTLSGLSQSRYTGEPGKHTVNVSFNVTNNGLFDENVRIQLQVTGPNGYVSNGPETALGIIAPSITKQFPGVLNWPVPSGAVDGSYSLIVRVLGDIGDIAPVDNVQQGMLYVGKIPVNTAEMIAGSGVWLKVNTTANLKGYGGLAEAMFGWVHYAAQNGSKYDIAVEAFSGEYGAVVKKNGTVIYQKVGFDSKGKYDKPLYVDERLVLIVEEWGSDIMVYLAEPISTVGVKPKEQTTIPGVYVDYFADIGVAPECNFDSRNVFDAVVNSKGQVNYNRIQSTNLLVSNIKCERSNKGYSFRLTGKIPGNFPFVIQLEQAETYYDPPISADSASFKAVLNEKLVWLLGKLIVNNYNDISIAEKSIPSTVEGGSVAPLIVAVVKEGTLTPPEITLHWAIEGPNEYFQEVTKDGIVGQNQFDWDTNGLPVGNYRLSIKALSAGDYDSNDIELSKEITLSPAPPTVVEQVDNVAASSFSGGATATTSMPVLRGKVGESVPFKVSLKDATGVCKQEGHTFAKQLDAQGDTLGVEVLVKNPDLCEFSGNLTLVEGATSIRVTGHLNRHDDGLLDVPISVTPNTEPTASISYAYSSLNFTTQQTVTFTGNAADPDNDGIVATVWEVRKPDGKVVSHLNVDSVQVRPDLTGNYSLAFFAIDSLGKQSNVSHLDFQYTPQQDNQLYSVFATAGTGGTVTPDQDEVESGTMAHFTVAPQNGYTKNLNVGGTCPSGIWDFNSYTTGAISGDCSVDFSFIQDNIAPPVSPNGVTASNGTYADKVHVTWSASSGATSYGVYRAASSTGTPTFIGTSVENSYDDTTAVPGTSYWYRVTAKNQDGESALSPAAQGSTASDLLLQEDFESYALGKPGGNWTFNSNWGNSGTIKIVNALFSQGKQSIKVTGETGRCQGIFSQSSFHNTDVSIVFDAYVPSGNAEGTGPGAIMYGGIATWFYAGVNGTVQARIAHDPTISISGLTADAWHTFELRVDWDNSKGELLCDGKSTGVFDFTPNSNGGWGSDLSLYGNNSSATNTVYFDQIRMTEASYNLVGAVPDPPSEVTASDGSYAGKVQVSWAASTEATSYQVYRATSATGTPTQIGTVNAPATSYDDGSAVAGTTYWYWVKASSLAGDSDFSSSDSGYHSGEVPVDWPDEVLIKMDVNFAKPNWGTYPSVRLYSTAPTEMDGPGNPYSLNIFNAYMDGHPSEIGIFDKGGVHRYYSPAIQAGVWYTVIIRHTMSTQTADITIENPGTSGPVAFYTKTAVPLVLEPFKHLGVGYYGAPDYGSDWSPIRLDNVSIKAADGRIMYEDNFQSDPGYTSYSSTYAYWDQAAGNYYVNTRDNLTGKYWAHSPELSYDAPIIRNSAMLSVTVTGSGGGAVNSNPGGIACTEGTCSASFPAHTQVTLMALADANSQFTGWSGANCSGATNCAQVLDMDTAVTATFDYVKPVRIVGATPTYFTSLYDAYLAAATGSVVQVRSGDFTGNLLLDRDIAIKITGGYDNGYTTNTGRSVISGVLKIRRGSLKCNNLSIR